MGISLSNSTDVALILESKRQSGYRPQPVIRPLFISFVLFITACAEDIRQTPDPDNQAPSAVLVTALTETVGVPVILDGSDSSDEDGTIVEYAFSTGRDGEVLITAENRVEVTYLTPGEYTVRLSVTDDDGARDAVAANISVLP